MDEELIELVGGPADGERYFVPYLGGEFRWGKGPRHRYMRTDRATADRKAWIYAYWYWPSLPEYINCPCGPS